jgi:hypothetical protein
METPATAIVVVTVVVKTRLVAKTRVAAVAASSVPIYCLAAIAVVTATVIRGKIALTAHSTAALASPPWRIAPTV